MTKKTVKEETAIAKRLHELGLSVEKGRDYLRDKGVDISVNYLGSIARGQKEPAVPLARRLAEALEIDASEVIKL